MANLFKEAVLDQGPDTPIEYFNKSKYLINTSNQKRRDILLARAREKEEDKALFINKFKKLFKTFNLLPAL